MNYNMSLLVVEALLALAITCSLWETTSAYYQQNDSQQAESVLKILRMHIRNSYWFSDQMKANAAELIEASDVGEMKCNLGTFVNYQRLLFDNTPVAKSIRPHINVIPYLRYWQYQQLELCKPMFARDLEQAIRGLGEEDKRDIIRLSESIHGVESQLNEDVHQAILKSRLIYGLVAFMVARRADYHHHADGEQCSPKKELVHDLANLCVHVIKAIDKTLVYSVFILRRELILRMDKSAFDWITGVRVCKYIHSNLDAITDETLRVWNPCNLKAKTKRSKRLMNQLKKVKSFFGG